jgi:hypothetical protein
MLVKPHPLVPAQIPDVPRPSSGARVDGRNGFVLDLVRNGPLGDVFCTRQGSPKG